MKRSTTLFVHFFTCHFSTIQTTCNLYLDTLSASTHGVSNCHLDSATISNHVLNLSRNILTNDSSIKLRLFNLEDVDLNIFLIPPPRWRSITVLKENSPKPSLTRPRSCSPSPTCWTRRTTAPGSLPAAMTAVLSGQVDAIVLTGGVIYSQAFRQLLLSRISYLGRVICKPGEEEMDSLAYYLNAVLTGELQPKEYN